MIANVIAGLGVGLGVFYLVYTLVEVDGWVTANQLLGIGPRGLETTDDLIAAIAVERPWLAQWMGCMYCMTPWWAALFTLLTNVSLLTWLTGIGISAALITFFDKRPA